MKLLFVVNPISGGIDKEPFLNKAKSLCDKYGIKHRIFKTSNNDDERKLAKLITTFSPDKVASVGGDGTTLFTAIALLNTNIPMGIIPLGSANGMAAELFVNENPLEALKDVIMSNIIGDLDMVLVNDKHYSVHIGDVGINAQIVESYDKDKNRGMTTYAKYFIEELKNIRPFRVKIEANDETINEECVMVGICNSRKYGTGIPLNLEGNPMDGKFEIVIIEQVDAKSLINAGLTKYNDEFYDGENSKVISANKAKIHFEEPRTLQLDGEVIGEFKELNIEIIQGAVKLITNKENSYLS